MHTKKRNNSKNSRTKKHKLTRHDLDVHCSKLEQVSNSFESEYSKKISKSLTNHHKDVQTELIELFNKPFTPTKYRAQDDFYTYINYEWNKYESKILKKTKEYYVEVDNFRVTQEKVYYQLIDLVKEYIKTNHSTQSTALKNVFNSLYNLDERSAENCIHQCVSEIDGYISRGNIYELFGNMNKNELVSWGSPIVWSVTKDQKNVSRYRTNISAPALTAYDYQIYIQDYGTPEEQKYNREYKKKYMTFLDKMFNLCLGSGHGLKSSDVWDCEYELLNAMGCNSVKNEDPDNHNVLTQSEALKYGFDWNELAKQIGYKTCPTTFLCTSKNYLKCVMELLTKNDAWKTEKWRTYFLYIHFRQIIRFHKKGRIIYFDFFEKFVKGQGEAMPQDIYTIFGLSFCFNTLLTNEYINKYKKQKYIDYVHNFGTDLLTVFKRIITRNKWLSPSTKKFALLKLNKIHLIIGRPDKLRDDPLLHYDNKNAYKNMSLLAKWRTTKSIALDGNSSDEDIPMIDWNEFKLVGKQSYVVNAFYTPTENSIYVPLAYLQKPFIDIDNESIEYNLAFIGYTLGHEMSHSLDDMGSKYDEKGNLHNWWTKHDRSIFNSKVKDVIKQYEKYASYDGIIMDAKSSTGEDLADISGMAICEEYLKDYHYNKGDISALTSISFHSFFIYLAIQSRQKIFKQAIKAQLKTNPHPMEKYRTNCPLSRLKLFTSFYNIKKGDKMFWPSKDTIW